MSHEPYGYDTDGDGWLDGEDHGSFYDYDFDGEVGLLDFAFFGAHFGHACP